jgi:ribosomal protein S6 kinase alpha-5
MLFRRITNKEPPIPSSFSREAKDLIIKLLCKNPSQRLGSGPTGANEIRRHNFFKVRRTTFAGKHKLWLIK